MDETEILQNLRVRCPSAWIGHEAFALWLVRELRPETIVDLGVDYGFSTFVWAIPRIGRVYGIDWFKGDPHTQSRDTRDAVMSTLAWMRDACGVDNVEIAAESFEDAARRWDRPIDILHIDGYHTYEAVQRDYETWSPRVRDGGVILFHDVEVRFGDFRVYEVWSRIPLPKTKFLHSHGLGIVSRDAALIRTIQRTYGLQ